jgi:Flp pilus assembly protein TadD
MARKILDNPDEHPIVRAAAIGLFMPLPDADPREGGNIVRRSLMRHIDDPSRLVRTEAIRVLVSSGAYRWLTDTERTRVDLAIDELHDALMVASDRAGAHMGWAIMCEGRGRFAEAQQAYETAMKVEPLMAGPRTNLAALLESQAANAPPAEAARLVSRAKKLRAEELPLLARDASLAPDNADLQYRYGLALYLSGDMEGAMKQLQLTVDLAPDVELFRTARDLLKEKISQ